MMAKKTVAKSGGREGANSDLDVLRQLVELLDKSTATSIKLARGDASYEVSRGPGGMMMAPMPMAAHHAAPAPSHAAPPAGSPSSGAPPVPEKSNLLEIKSPMVGTFYKSPEPGAEAYARVGTRVAPGQTLCIIEAMKIMNELESEVAGTIREILVEDAQPVEFGQVLFRVEP
jgi:acetyl-CoA carboxylase biotin carboxyl carrier protein